MSKINVKSSTNHVIFYSGIFHFYISFFKPISEKFTTSREEERKSTNLLKKYVKIN